MKVVIQRVTSASVKINNQLHGQIGKGMLILLGIAPDDTNADIEWLCHKINSLRIFDDENHVMNLDIHAVGGECLIVSQFTLMAMTKKGNRPSYIRAAEPSIAIPLYEQFIDKMQESFSSKIQTGIFGADMQVQLVNDGPVTIIIDTKQKE
ncbi:MAG: D-tyrosyl-tRNA(Tyr) deacylase [Bacteroidales bacterium]|jgi:D-tyrosyl-tRNA(Tyr) deacylase|nr:D-tyrosyl-tRNA(Tyr) deacylase [Bacteroidales bacterium]